MSQSKSILLCAMMLSFIVSLAGCGGEKEELQFSQEKEKEIAERLAPAGEVTLEGDVKVASSSIAESSSGARSGEEIYNTKCMACHATGAAGAPKKGVPADWEGRMAKGVEALYSSAIKGFKGMPPKGLCMDCSDEELKVTVDYMLEK